jgi:hypothetical protein
MNDITEQYKVKIINTFEDFDEPLVTEFVCHDRESTKTMIAAYSGFYSGDPIDVFINGEKAVTHLDWGLVDVT